MESWDNVLIGFSEAPFYINWAAKPAIDLVVGFMNMDLVLIATEMWLPIWLDKFYDIPIVAVD